MAVPVKTGRDDRGAWLGLAAAACCYTGVSGRFVCCGPAGVPVVPRVRLWTLPLLCLCPFTRRADWTMSRRRPPQCIGVRSPRATLRQQALLYVHEWLHRARATHFICRSVTRPLRPASAGQQHVISVANGLNYSHPQCTMATSQHLGKHIMNIVKRNAR